MKFTKLFYVAGISLVVLASCKKLLDLQDLAGGTQAAEDNAIAQQLFQDLYKQVEDGAQGEDSLRNPLCPNITISFTQQVVFPATAVIDFGTGCQGADGKFRSGQINVVFQRRWRDQGLVCTATTSNYTVNGYRLSGTKTITNDGRNAQQQLMFHVEVSNAVITAPDGRTITYTADTHYTWEAGETTVGILDDVYTIYGTANGVGRDGRAYTMSVAQTSPLRWVASCNDLHVVSGILSVTPTGFAARTIDFGSGACDKVVTLTVGSWGPYTINLP